MDNQQLDAFEVLEKIILIAPHTELPALFAGLAKLQAIALSRLCAPSSPPAADEPDHLLTAEQAAPMLGITPGQLKRRRRLPFRRPLGHKTIRYSANGIRKYLAKRPV